MEPSELDRQIAEVVENGFKESFIRFCADTFSSYVYSPEGLALARMHAHYLRLALEYFSLTLGEERTLQDIPYFEECLSVASESYRSALESDRPFCEEFVERWCSRFATSAREGGEL